GLSARQKTLPARYLYDELGSALFQAITLLPEYGLTRAEERVLNRCADDIARSLAPVAMVAELGSGSGEKTMRLLKALSCHQPNLAYYAIDVSGRSLEECCRQAQTIPGIRARALEASYLEGLATVRDRRPTSGSLLLLFLGSSIGNFSADEVSGFLKRLRQNMRPGDAFLLGTDLLKPTDKLIAAYDDVAGVTAAFNLNLLSRINRELQADFQVRKFRHEARWNREHKRIEMHLVSLEPQTVTVGAIDCEVFFDAGESIWTEASQKFTAMMLAQLAQETGFAVTAQWIDEEWPFAESLWFAI
ncbi:MAG TPA: L-histidine N(alpha)-methyltransferase, partial [Terriglobia bacterium]|nr:L-histidine N(alpha)-methyltransferase [Terriglobia bacterium]